MHARHPKIASKWDAEAEGKPVAKRYAQSSAVGRRQEVAKAARVKLEPMVRATKEHRDAPMWPLAAAVGDKDASRLLAVRRLQKTKGNVKVLGKGFSQQSVAPKLARKIAAAGRGANRVLTGDKQTGVIGKGVLADVAMAMRGAQGPASQKASGAVAGVRAARLKPATTAATAGIAGAAGGYGANKGVSKRRFDPEDERRHRQGLYAGAGLTGGAVATGYGVRGTARDTQALRKVPDYPAPGREPSMPSFVRAGNTNVEFANLSPAKQLELKALHDKKHGRWSENKTRHETIASLKTKRGVVLRGRNAALLGGGIGAMAGAAALHSQRRESRWD